MLMTLVYFLIALVVAWHAGPWLTKVFWLLPVRELAELLTPEHIFGHSAAFYFGFLIWLVILFTALKKRGLFGILYRTQGAGSTKLVRRIQGLAMEAALVAVFCIPPLVILTNCGVGRNMILDGLEREFGPKFIEAATSPLVAKVEEIDQLSMNNSSHRMLLKGQKIFENVKDIFKAQENRGQGAAQIQGEIERLQSADVALEEGKRLIENDVATLTANYHSGDVQAVAIVREAMWQEVTARPWRLTFLAVRNLWMLVLPPGLLLYVLLHQKVKYEFAGRYVRVLTFFKQMRMGFGGSRTMAGAVEEWELRKDLGNLGDGIFIGRSLYNPWLFLTLKDDRHMLTIAGSRTGKGSTAIIPTLLEWTGSVIVPDIKGTNYAVTARRRREMGQDVYVYAPFEKETNSCNPLRSLDPNSPTIREEIAILAESFVLPNHDPQSEHWDEAARTILAGLIDDLITPGKYENPTLPMIRDLLNLPFEDQTRLWAEMSESESVAGWAKDAAAWIISSAGTDELSGFFSTLRKHTNWLGSKSIRKVLAGDTPSPFALAKEKPTSIYIVLPSHLYKIHKRFMRLFINMAIMGISIGGAAAIPNLLILDEFLALGRLDEVETAFNLSAGHNLIIWALAQNYGGLEKIYGSSVHSFVTNSRAVQVFGVSDKDSTSFVSDQIGELSLVDAWGPHQSNKIVPLRTPAEVAMDIEKDTRRQYIIRPGKSVMLAERVDYFKPAGERLFAGKYDPDPDHN